MRRETIDTLQYFETLFPKGLGASSIRSCSPHAKMVDLDNLNEQCHWAQLNWRHSSDVLLWQKFESLKLESGHEEV